MDKLRVLIPAAGRGSRAGLPYPKTLYPINGVPILHRLLTVLSPFDSSPTVVVSPQGEDLIRASLQNASLTAHIVVQAEPTGMGDAALCFSQSPSSDAEHILLAWGDLAGLQASTVSSTVQEHFASGNDFTFPTCFTDHPYTIVKRDISGQVLSVVESRETSPHLKHGERDIGLFVFRRQPVFSCLRSSRSTSISVTTGEHGFLYTIAHLVQSGYLVEALPLATEKDLKSLNYISNVS